MSEPSAPQGPVPKGSAVDVEDGARPPPAAAGGPPAPALAILSPGSSFSGLLVLHGSARIEGRVEGEIVGADVLSISESGSVEADVDTGELVVEGALEGDVRATRRVELRSTARVRGRIETPRLIVAEGSFFEGACQAGGDPGAAPGVSREEPGSP